MLSKLQEHRECAPYVTEYSLQVRSSAWRTGTNNHRTDQRFYQGQKKLNGNLLYTILPIEQAKQHFYKRQFENLDQAIAEDKQRKRIEKLDLKPNKQAVWRATGANMADIIWKQDKVRGQQAAPSQITSDGRADRKKHFEEKKTLIKRRSLGKGEKL